MATYKDDEIQDMIKNRFLTKTFDLEKNKLYAIELCDPANVLIFMRSKSFEGQTDQVMEWYDTKYSINDFSDEFYKLMREPNCEITDKKLDLPPPNTLIAKNFDILPKDAAKAQKPKEIEEGLWYKKDDQFNRPKSIVKLKVYTNDCLYQILPEARAFVNLWVAILDEYLGEFSYMAAECRLGFSVDVDNDGINMKWSGYNDSIPAYVKQLMEKVKAMQDSKDLEKLFDQLKEKLLKDMKNYYYGATYTQAAGMLPNILIDKNFEKKVLRTHLEALDFAKFNKYKDQWLKNGKQVWYTYGNISQEDAKMMVHEVQQIISLSPIEVEDLLDVRPIKMEAGTCTSMMKKLEDENNANTCAVAHYEVGSKTADLKAYLVNDIVMQYLNEPFFNDCRTN
jgi:secreted Zn-dependent insulinase-like peptidase